MDYVKLSFGAEGNSAKFGRPDGQGGEGLGYIPFAFPGVAGVRCVFSTAGAGSLGLGYGPEGGKAEADTVVRNRSSLLSSLGVTRWVELRQVHQDHVCVDPAPTGLEENSTLEGDGSCTAQSGLALAIKTADCQPILLTDLRGSAVAALHVGWRGNVMDFPVSGVARFCQAYGLAPKDLLAVRGPSLGPAAAEFVNFDREWPERFRPWYDENRKTMDLWSLVRVQLVRAGLRAGNIFSLDLCTWSLPGFFFSHRRGHTGRQVSLIWKE